MQNIYSKLRGLDALGRVDIEFDQYRNINGLPAAIAMFASMVYVAQARHLIIAPLLVAFDADDSGKHDEQLRNVLAVQIERSEAHVRYYAARFEQMNALSVRAELVAHAELSRELKSLLEN